MKQFYDNDFFKSVFFKAKTFVGRPEGKHFIKKPKKKRKPKKDL